ncbi:hypothetical protein Tco_0456043 [Tanacetum coccineum]
MNVGLKPISNDEQLNDFVQVVCENDYHLDMYTEHQGYDVLEMDIVDFQTDGEENVDITKLSTDDPWLDKLVGKGKFVGEIEDLVLGLSGRKKIPSSAFKNDEYEVREAVGTMDHLTPNQVAFPGKRGQRESSEPSKVSQATKERWRKTKLEETKKLKNAIDCPFRLWASWMSTEKSFQIKTLYPDHKCCGNYNLEALVTYRWIAEHYAREIIVNPWVSYKYMQNSIRKKFLINVTLGQCKREKQTALFDHEGGLIDHYSRL